MNGPAGAAPRDLPHVVIVGGGFGGLYAAFALDGRPVRVTLVDRRNHHLFQPLLYQVATAGLSPGDIAQPIRHILRRIPNVAVVLAEATAVDLTRRRLVLADGELAYDALILATGASHAYFGHDEWRPLAPGLKTIEDALEIRRRVLLAFEAAEREPDEARRRALLTFVIVGGGPTGVELAGALAEIARDALAHEYRAIDPAQARIVLIEAGPRLLSAFAEPLGAAAARVLGARGVEVLTRTAVTRIAPGLVEAGPLLIRAETVLWAAGVTASPLARSLGVPLDRAGRVLVEPDLTIPGHPEVFVIGDLAAFRQPDGQALPGLAPVAIQMGRHAAQNILRATRGEARQPFRYRDRGMLATIGRHAAVAQRGRLQLHGWLAWLAWVIVHIFFLIGFRNRLLVMIEWAWAYATFNRGVRLITGDTELASRRNHAEEPPQGRARAS
ncbi:MAG TPA: NAD(P)/FAD-dependent oxidoreductase [Methylomirabilota bacterium]|jgi:NADH dehydrogenase|nr:NAD(P)/FAD-dependent oxidoreductase [Methylomirabilota bacterium]